MLPHGGDQGSIKRRQNENAGCPNEQSAFFVPHQP